MGRPIFNTVFVLALTATSSVVTTGVRADEYPSRPIKFITTGGPGGASDVICRIIAEGLKDQLGQAVVVENKMGGMSLPGYRALMSAPPDGYTILLVATEVTVTPLMAKSHASIDPLKDMAPVARAVNTWGALAASPKSGFKTLKDLITHAKAHPGAVKVGLNQQALTLRFPVEMLQTEAGIDLKTILYKTTSQALTDTMNGEVQMSSMSVPCPTSPRRPSSACPTSPSISGLESWRRRKHRSPSLRAWPRRWSAR
jgi:tripartite-type tricarboxylate transporter receptor subunit TctC